MRKEQDGALRGLGWRLCRSSGWPHRLGTSVFATSSAERSLELDESFQAIQYPTSQSVGGAKLVAHPSDPYGRAPNLAPSAKVF